MAISPPELLSEAERTQAGGEPPRVLAHWLESYAEVWREREELRGRVKRLEAAVGRLPASPPARAPVRRRPKALAAVVHTAFAALALVAVAATVAMVAVVGGLYELDARDTDPSARAASDPAAPTPSAPQPRAHEAAGPVKPAPSEIDRGEGERRDVAAAAAPPTLRLTASRGESWLRVTRGSPSGKVLFEGVLARGESATFSGEPLVLRVGAPDSLEGELDGKPLRLPPGTADVLVDSGGLRVLAVG